MLFNDGNNSKISLARQRYNISLCGVVYDMKGYERFHASGLDTICVYTSASNTHSKHYSYGHHNMKDALSNTCNIIKAAVSNDKRHKVRAYINVAFGCPFENEVEEDSVVNIAQAYKENGADTIILSDPLGVAYASQIRSLINRMTSVKVGIPINSIGLHLHDNSTSGTAGLNIAAGLEAGICHIDSSIGGLGCSAMLGVRDVCDDKVVDDRNVEYSGGTNTNTRLVMDIIRKMEGKHDIDLESLLDVRDFLRRKLPYRRGGIH